MQESFRSLLNRRNILIVAISLLVIVTVLGVLRIAPYKTLSIQETPFSYQDHFSYMSGDDIFSYNGLLFTKTNTESGQSTVLFGGMKLPKPKALFWAGDKGVLINFEGSFYGSEVDKVLARQGISLDAASKLYTWYLSFETKQLSIASRLPVERSKAVYSENNKGFYFIPDVFNTALPDDSYQEIASGSPPFIFYGIETGQERVIVEQTNLTDISFLGKCSESRVCLVARDLNSTESVKLYRLEDNKLVENVSANSDIIATNNENVFMLGTVDPASTESEDVDKFNVAYSFYDIGTGTKRSIGTLSPTNNLIPMVSDNDYTLLNSDAFSRNTVYTQGAKNVISLYISQQSILKMGSQNFSGSLLNNVSYGNGNTALVNTADNRQVIIKPESRSLQVPTTSSNEVRNRLEKCVAGADGFDYFEEDRIYRLYFSDDQTLNTGLSRLTGCFSEHSSVLLGALFEIVLRDPVNGRIVSD